MKFFFLLGLSILLLSGDDSGELQTLHFRITDSETGLILAAKVAVSEADGGEITPNGSPDFGQYLGKTWYYVNGDFSVTTASKQIQVEILRGPETLPYRELIDLTAEQDPVMEFRLERWVNMEQKGMMSGDSHMHLPAEESALLQMKAEDLHVANLLTSDFNEGDLEFTGHLSPVSTGEEFVFVGQEIRDWQLGHANFLNLPSIVEPLKPFGGSLFTQGSNPHMLLSPRLEEAKMKGATVVWAHYSNLPGLESPLAFILGLVDAIELMTYDDPTQLPSHQAAWDYSPYQPAEFPPMAGMNLWYQYLNAGVRIPITAGTDKMSPRIPVGSNRNYVRIVGDMNYDSWLEGMKQGKGFVTNAPLLSFSVNGHLSGEVIEFMGTKRVNVKVKAESLLPFGRVEIILNGKLIAWEYLEEYSRQRELYVAQVETEVSLDGSSWIAGRVSSLDTRQMLPRNLTVFAHSNPVYFLKDGQKVKVESSVNYLLRYLDSYENWILNHSDFEDKEDGSMALDKLEMTRKILGQYE